MTHQVCIANIGAAQRQRRHRSGLIGLVLGSAILVGGLLVSVTPFLVAVGGSVMLLGGFVGVFQARGKT